MGNAVFVVYFGDRHETKVAVEGLQVRLRKHLVDVKRSQSYTRYFLAERVGGNPANMGWESQAVMLVPVAQLAQVLNSPNDVPIIDALKQV